MPLRTSLMSAPSRSQRFAISLMKLILVASMALAAYLVISADSGLIDEEGPLRAQEGGIEFAEHLADLWLANADDDAIGLHEVVDGRAFLQELGITRDIDVTTTLRREPLGDLRVRADWNGTLHDDDAVARLPGLKRTEHLGDGIGDSENRTEIGIARFRLRRADGDEDQPGGANGRGEVAAEGEPAVAFVALNEFEQIPARRSGRRLSLSVAIFFGLLSRHTTSLPLSARQVPVTSPT